MAEFVKEYFSHDYNARGDRKMLALRKKEGMRGVGIYWCIVEMLYAEGGHLPHTEFENIAFELRVKPEIVRRVVCDYELFHVNGEKFWSDSVLKRIDERKLKSDKAKESANGRWNGGKQDAIALPPHSEGNAIKESKGNEKKESGKPTQFFGVQSPDYIIVKKKYANEQTCRINGADGLAQYMHANESVLTHPDLASKFMRTRRGDYFNEFMHLKRSFALFVEKQYA